MSTERYLQDITKAAKEGITGKHEADRLEEVQYLIDTSFIQGVIRGIVQDNPEIREDEMLSELIRPGVEGILKEYAVTSVFGEMLQNFKEFLRDTLSSGRSEEEVEIELEGVVECILNGEDVRQSILFEGNPKIKLR